MAFSTPVPASPLSSMTSPTVIDIFDALHPQTILAYGTIGLDLPILMELRCACEWKVNWVTRA